jgi:hypothetical protein
MGTVGIFVVAGMTVVFVYSFTRYFIALIKPEPSDDSPIWFRALVGGFAGLFALACGAVLMRIWWGVFASLWKK